MFSCGNNLWRRKWRQQQLRSGSVWNFKMLLYIMLSCVYASFGRCNFQESQKPWSIFFCSDFDRKCFPSRFLHTSVYRPQTVWILLLHIHHKVEVDLWVSSALSRDSGSGSGSGSLSLKLPLFIPPEGKKKLQLCFENKRWLDDAEDASWILQAPLEQVSDEMHVLHLIISEILEVHWQ